MILSSLILFAALRCDPSVMSVYSLPAGAVHSEIAPSSVPGAVPAADASKRLTGATFSAMYGLREALFQRWLVTRLNATYGGAATADWSNLPAVDFMSTNTAATTTNGYWFDPQTFILDDEAEDHAKRNISSPRISVKIVEPVDAICDALKQNSPISGLVPQTESSYESSLNKVRTWLDPSVDHISLVHGQWQRNGDDSLADVDAGFLRSLHESPNDLAAADSCGLFGDSVQPASLRGKYVTGKMEQGGLKDSMLEKFYTDDGLHRAAATNLSAFLSALAPGLPSNAVSQAAIANAKSRRIDWSRFALANAVTSLASTYFASDIAASYGMADEDAVGNLWRSPGGCQCVAVAENIYVDAVSETSYECAETTDEDDDSKILIAAVESPTTGARALAYLFDTSNLVDCVKSHVVTNDGSQISVYTNDINQAYDFYYEDFDDGSTIVVVSAGLLIDFYPNALVESTADDGYFKFVKTTLEKIPPGVYPADNFRVKVSQETVGDAVNRDRLFIYTFPPEGETTPTIPEYAQNLPLFELNPMRSSRKIRVHVLRHAGGSGVRPAAEQPAVVTADKWDTYAIDDMTRMRAPGVLPKGCPLVSCLDRAAVFNYSTIFVSFLPKADVRRGEMTFVDPSNPSFAYSRLTAENAAPCDDDALQTACEKPWLSMRDDLATKEADALERVDYTIIRDGVKVNLAETTPSLFDDDRLNLGRASDRTTEMTNLTPSVSKSLPTDAFPMAGLALLVEDKQTEDDDGNVSTTRTASWISDQLDSHDAYQPCTQMWCRVSLADYVVASTNLPPRRTAVLEYDNVSSLYMKFKFPMMGDETFTTKEN